MGYGLFYGAWMLMMMRKCDYTQEKKINVNVSTISKFVCAEKNVNATRK